MAIYYQRIESGLVVEQIDDSGVYFLDGSALVKARDLTAEEAVGFNTPPDPRTLKIADIEARIADGPLLADERNELLADLLDLVKGE